MRIKKYISFFFLFLPYQYVKKQVTWNVVLDDISYWLYCYHEQNNKIGFRDFVYLMVKHRAFRNVFYYRVKKCNMLIYLIRMLYPPQNEPIICCEGEIKGGLFFCHGFSTIVVAKSIGQNCWINQQVTIGANSQYGYPTIGDDVHIFAGALVIGDITIGNNVVIGAGAVVTKSVPDNCTVVGNPARIIRRNGVKVNESL